MANDTFKKDTNKIKKIFTQHYAHAFFNTIITHRNVLCRGCEQQLPIQAVQHDCRKSPFVKFERTPRRAYERMDKDYVWNTFVDEVNSSDIANSIVTRMFLHHCCLEDKCFKMISRLKFPIALSMDSIALQRPHNTGWVFDGCINPKT